MMLKASNHSRSIMCLAETSGSSEEITIPREETTASNIETTTGGKKLPKFQLSFVLLFRYFNFRIQRIGRRNNNTN